MEVASPPRSIDAGVGIGEIFLDKFRVDAFLGHGGMGIVALCTHLALDERVAIKMLRRDVLDDDEAVERFMREAQAASKLKSEYVARVTDVGRSRANVPYMVMEYLEGHDLDELLEERGSLGIPWAVELTLQACEALTEAHSIGIVHRDVKPSNLFVTWRPDGSPLVKVLDFGISKALSSEAMQLTQTQSLLGTPAYMSPEQMRSARQVDGRTDIWSLGTVLYEMLEGHRPFEAESFSEMCVKVAVDSPGAMSSTPLQLQQVVLRCLAKLPEQRYASMAELARDLAPFSQDPHQARVLVERMARMLRHSQVFGAAPRGGPRAAAKPARSQPPSNPLLSNPLDDDLLLSSEVLATAALANAALENAALTAQALANLALADPAMFDAAMSNPALALSDAALPNVVLSSQALENPAHSKPAFSNQAFANPVLANRAFSNPAISSPVLSNLELSNPAQANAAFASSAYAVSPAEAAAAPVPVPRQRLVRPGSLTETYAIPRLRRRRMIIAVAAIAVAAIVGVAVSQLRNPARVAHVPAASAQPPSAPPAVPAVPVEGQAGASFDEAQAGSAAPARDAKPDRPAAGQDRAIRSSGKARTDVKPGGTPDRTGDAAAQDCDVFGGPHATTACPPAGPGAN